jgi:hypothetical protein
VDGAGTESSQYSKHGQCVSASQQTGSNPVAGKACGMKSPENGITGNCLDISAKGQVVSCWATTFEEVFPERALGFAEALFL